MEEKITFQEITVKGFRFSYLDNENQEIARARLYILKNDLHPEPLGYIEDVFVNENYRGQGIGTKILNEIINKAKEENCYKIVCTSRFSKPEAHQFYEKLGFEKFGYEFRLNLK